jgi:hypothetical protein
MAKKRISSNRKQPRKTINKNEQSSIRHRFGRRQATMVVVGVAAVAVGVFIFPELFGSNPAMAEEIVVYKNPSCGCCGGWVNHLRRTGFKVTVNNIEDLDPIKNKAGVPDGMESCHTAFVAGYVVEGHVPAENIKKILAERPEMKGLAVPGMPSSAPGMDSPDHEPYTVYSFDAKGASKVYASY